MFVVPRRSRRALLLLALRPTWTAAGEQSCSASKGPLPYTLLAKWQQSPDSWLLRYSLPEGRRYLGEDPTLPTCVKVLFANGTDEHTGESKALEKSYSPVSHPATERFVDYIVKSYPPRSVLGHPSNSSRQHCHFHAGHYATDVSPASILTSHVRCLVPAGRRGRQVPV